MQKFLAEVGIEIGSPTRDALIVIRPVGHEVAQDAERLRAFQQIPKKHYRLEAIDLRPGAMIKIQQCDIPI